MITLFEHQYRSYSEVGVDPDGPIVRGLEEVNNAAGTEIIQLLRKGLRAVQYVGVVQVGDTTIQILPKIDYAASGKVDASVNTTPFVQAQDSAVRNLLYLLSYTRDFSIREADVAMMAKQTSSWFELLTRLFAVNLHNQMQRGMERNYRLVEDELPVMRGRWQIERQIRRKPHVHHRFDVVYDEFSADTPLNRVFRYVIDALLLITQDAQNHSLLLDLSDWLLPVKLQANITVDQLDRVLFTRLNERFKPAFNLARLFIEGSALQLSSGRLHTFTFVLDMNYLFEAFLEGFIRRHRLEILPEDWGEVTIRRQSKGKTLYLAQRQADSKPIFRLQPDILFTRPSGIPVLILDTKYKGLEFAKGDRGVSEGDIYQMLAYEVRMKCKNTLAVYPAQKTGLALRERFSYYEDVGEVLVATINLHHPLAKPESLIQELRTIFSLL